MITKDYFVNYHKNRLNDLNDEIDKWLTETVLEDYINSGDRYDITCILSKYRLTSYTIEEILTQRGFEVEIKSDINSSDEYETTVVFFDDPQKWYFTKEK